MDAVSPGFFEPATEGGYVSRVRPFQASHCRDSLQARKIAPGRDSQPISNSRQDGWPFQARSDVSLSDPVKVKTASGMLHTFAGMLLSYRMQRRLSVGISLCLRLNQREIAHFVRNDKINYLCLRPARRATDNVEETGCFAGPYAFLATACAFQICPYPPSTLISTPVMYDASCEAKNATVAATSSG